MRIETLPVKTKLGIGLVMAVGALAGCKEANAQADPAPIETTTTHENPTPTPSVTESATPAPSATATETTAPAPVETTAPAPADPTSPSATPNQTGASTATVYGVAYTCEDLSPLSTAGTPECNPDIQAAIAKYGNRDFDTFEDAFGVGMMSDDNYAMIKGVASMALLACNSDPQNFNGFSQQFLTYEDRYDYSPVQTFVSETDLHPLVWNYAHDYICNDTPYQQAAEQ